MRKEDIPKILAIYLPQFYENEDNNQWWGKGFTDWESVKTAESYFPGHFEPRVPLHSDYYDLSQKDTMIRQAELARKYGIDGFCFYYYYFKDGKKELELPAENLLKWKDIDMPFCFNWASESWIRSWSKISGNVWAERYENAGESIQSGILVEQDYGTSKDWVRHFKYLLPFFRDKRYIKHEGKPVFVFYSPNDIQPLNDMVSCWRREAIASGLPGLYLIGAHLDAPNEFLDAAMIYEPRNSINVLNSEEEIELRSGIRCFDYQRIWTNVLKSEPIFGCKTYFCGVVGYDDTPRRGRSGEAIINNSPQIFQDNLKKLIEKSTRYGNEYLFINAWNEWGEGMYLEPDEQNKYTYLEAVKNAIHNVSVTLEECITATEYPESVKKEIALISYNAKKFKCLFQIMDKWLYLERENCVNFSAFLNSEGIKRVAIYGMASLGKHLLIQLRRESIIVAFGIDRYVGQYGDDITIYRPEDKFPQADAIIITSYDIISITQMLRCKYEGKIYSLEEIIDSMIRKNV